MLETSIPYPKNLNSTKKMKICPLFLLLIPVLVRGQVEYPVSNISPDLLVNAHLVVRIDETTFTIQSDGDAMLEETYVATILKEEGKNAGTTGGQESRFSKIKLLKGRIFDAAGNLVYTTKEDDKELGTNIVVI